MNISTTKNTKVAELLLRIGLAIVFAYAAVAAINDPAAWIGFLPHFITTIVSADFALKGFSLFQLLLAGWLLSGKCIKYAALLSAVMLAGIVVLNGSLLIITFRDIALVCMSVALFFMV